MRSVMVAPTARLADLTSGTTFAAKARAAELNAVRAAKAAKAAEHLNENEVPALQPLSLGSVKFTMPRNRGAKAWKPLNLHEVQEHSSEDDHDASCPQTARSMTQVHGFDGEQQPAETKRSVVDQDSPAPSYHLPSTRQNSFINDHQHPDTGQSLEQGAVNPYLTQLDRGMPLYNPSNPASTPFTGENQVLRGGIQYGTPFNSRLSTAQSRVPSFAKMYKPTMTHIRNDDPFIEPPKVNEQLNSATKFVSKPQGLHPSVPAHKQPDAVKGTMDLNFRFPQSAQHHLNTQITFNRQSVAAPKAAIISRKPSPSIAASGAPARDPKPYTSFSTTNSKKEMLLQNLEQVVESSKAKGDLPSATRTVLYDPYAPDTAAQSRSSNSSAYGKLSEAEHDGLRVSEPEVYAQRLVPIFNSPTAYTFEDSRANTIEDPPSVSGEDSRAPSFPPGLCPGNEYIYSLAEEFKPVPRHLKNDVEEWWTKDTRAQGIPRTTLNELANARFAKDPPGHWDTSASFGSTTSPTSTRTGSSIAPIGSERSSKTNNDLAEMMKQVCTNLESYVIPSEKLQNDYFGRFAPVPEWCIDKSPSGNDSFFGDWGIPPSRVGRDPRYRRTFHEGRHTVFEELDHRSARDGGLGRRYH